MNYKKLFELSILHEYYANKLCSDFILEPTIECRKILSGHRLIIKNKVNGIVIITPVNPDDENKPQIELAEDLQFTFVLKLKNPKLLNFTEGNLKGSIFFNLQEEQGENDLKCLSFSNKSQLGVVLLKEGFLLISFIELSIPQELEEALSLLLEVYVVLSLAEKLLEKTIELPEQYLPEGLKEKVILYEDLPKEKQKVLSLAQTLLEKPTELTQQYLPEGLQEKVILYEDLPDELKNKVILYEGLPHEKYEVLCLAKELLGKEKIKLSYEDLPGGEIVWGLVIIDNNSSMSTNLGENSDYQITFKPKKQKWRYYLITNLPRDKLLLIKGRREEISFSSFQELQSGDPMLNIFEQQFSDKQTVKRFSESTSEIPCQEMGIKNIALLISTIEKGASQEKKTLEELEVLIEHLPNPPNGNIIQVHNEETVRYQVINLLKNF
ncbi:hypothetical protein [Okeania sp. SIO2B3]|uniref:hypothetical protein n=1 Tax=Okeania sp. SIO2B3 TaxID=2607784 RepID=UPI0013C21645|nr:hypothetical protein [Okeania sp. SIO2B3]NET44165.1 hypothetical protein [Okeania sp. SIO2B3]